LKIWKHSRKKVGNFIFTLDQGSGVGYQESGAKIGNKRVKNPSLDRSPIFYAQKVMFIMVLKSDPYMNDSHQGGL